jgi:serine/threonine-protein kinase
MEATGLLSMNDAKAPGDPFGLCGTTIDDKYRIQSVVGSGGFGVVYRGEHAGFGEPIAVKCLKISSELDDEAKRELLARLSGEGRVLHRLSKASSGIVQALDVGAVTTSNKQWVPYLVLEWLEGETLAEHMKGRAKRKDGAYSVAEALALIEPAARALAVAHGEKVAHRDVKPENLYLTTVSGKRTMKVLDFGIAKVLSQHARFTAAPAATQKSATAFTPRYGAPEQFDKKRGATGPWTDVFALALIFVEVVSGKRALHGDDVTQLYIAAADPAARPTLRYQGIETSDAVEDTLCRAMAIDPADRFQDAGAFWDELTRVCRDAPVVARAETGDVSETGDYISKHDFALDPTELAVPPPPADALVLLPRNSYSDGGFVSFVIALCLTKVRTGRMCCFPFVCSNGMTMVDVWASSHATGPAEEAASRGRAAVAVGVEAAPFGRQGKADPHGMSRHQQRGNSAAASGHASDGSQVARAHRPRAEAGRTGRCAT